MFASLLAFTLSQLPGSTEVHPKITWQKCTKAGCTPQSGGIVLDSEWRAIVDANGKPCIKTDGNWDNTVCISESDCSQKCLLQGHDYTKVGVSTSGSAVRLKFVTPTGDIGSRVYLFDEIGGTYVNFKLINKEFTFDVDTSTIPCAVNGALYFSEMDADGGTARFPNNRAGAKYGTGYCDAQCPRDGKFIGNNANFNRKYGSCCFEWDVWEANVAATQMAAHTCSVSVPAYVCTGDCSQCDTGGCYWNPYLIESQALQSHTLYGKGRLVDSTKKFTVVTQFVSTDGTDSGSLKEVRRLYVQGGKVIPNNKKTDNGKSYDSICDGYCSGEYKSRGGDAAWTKSFKRGAVLAMSLWTDGSMAWLDSDNKGGCGGGSSKAQLIRDNPNAYVEYSNIRLGDIDTTY
jgi:cellulose 1,4-beta-cellobiosidase